jgi:dTDP-4-dehydrorhamnose 3,5-epimerase
MKIHQVNDIEGVRISPTKSVTDDRGTFVKFHPVKEFHGIMDSIAISFNPIPGTIRGLHFQTEPCAEEKLVTCIQGAIFDVVVDLREDSKTFGKWAAFELSATNTLQAFLPKGVAHGFQTLLSDSVVHYGLSAPYDPEYSYSIDPFGNLEIDWPLETNSVSKRDTSGVSFLFAAQKYAESLKN